MVEGEDGNAVAHDCQSVEVVERMAFDVDSHSSEDAVAADYAPDPADENEDDVGVAVGHEVEGEGSGYAFDDGDVVLSLVLDVLVLAGKDPSLWQDLHVLATTDWLKRWAWTDPSSDLIPFGSKNVAVDGGSCTAFAALDYFDSPPA